MADWSKRWYIKSNEGKTQAICFSYRSRPPEFLLTLNGRNIPFVNNVKYLDVIINNKITWRSHITTIKTKAFRIFFRACSLFKSERLSANIKLTLHKALIRSLVTYACSTWEFHAHLLKLQCLEKKCSAPLTIFQGTHRSGKCTWLSIFFMVITYINSGYVVGVSKVEMLRNLNKKQ
jgi:hypothetical protein